MMSVFYCSVFGTVAEMNVTAPLFFKGMIM
jgi:hypothetical protein